MTIGDTTMKIYKWVPVTNEQKKTKHKDANKENIVRKVTDSSNSNFSLAEDSNTCKNKFKIYFTFTLFEVNIYSIVLNIYIIVCK